MEQQTLIAAKLFVRDLVDGQTVDSVFAVRERTRRQKKNGEGFLKLQLGDISGTVEAVVWDGVDDLYERCPPGGVVREIGKIEAYSVSAGAIELSDSGKLQGEIALGYYLVRRLIEDIPGFPADTAQALLHIVLSHHGQLEHGSPVVPCTREATLVHMVDNLGGRLGSFDRIEKSLADGERWSAFDRALSGAAYFAPREARREN